MAPALSDPSARPAQICFNRVCVDYATAAGSMRVVDDVSLEIGEGEFVSLIGPSGCGKTTLMNVAGGFVTPTQGEVKVSGKPVTGPGPDRGVIFQEYGVFPWLTVRENIEFGLGLAANRHSIVQRRQISQRYMQLMGLADFADHYPKHLSGGMRQRVCIARTLVTQPRLILLDEPFGALDQQTRLLMGDEILSLWRKTGATIFLITHALDEAAMLADRIGVMSSRPGQLIDIVETNWPQGRDSRIVEDDAFGVVTARLWRSLRVESMKAIGKTEPRR